MSVTQYLTRGEYTRKLVHEEGFSPGDLQQRYERIVQRLGEEPQRYFEVAEPPVFSPVLQPASPGF